MGPFEFSVSPFLRRFTRVQGSALQFFELRSPSLLAPILFPGNALETAPQAWAKYCRRISQNISLARMFSGDIPRLEKMRFRPVSEKELSTKALMLMNSAKDYSRKSGRIVGFRRKLWDENMSLWMLPVAADLALEGHQRDQFHQIIAEKVPLLIVPGGDDVAPIHYRQSSRWCRDTNSERDRFEIALIKKYVAKGSGFLFGVCRGQQITSVALGYRLIQDIPTDLGLRVNHSDYAQHSVQKLMTRNALLLSACQDREVEVNSLHHQSVIYEDGGPLELSAVSDDGVVEALEFRNGRGLLVQFHPELMSNWFSKSLFAVVVDQTKNKFRFQRSANSN